MCCWWIWRCQFDAVRFLLDQTSDQRCAARGDRYGSPHSPQLSYKHHAGRVPGIRGGETYRGSGGILPIIFSFEWSGS